MKVIILLLVIFILFILFRNKSSFGSSKCTKINIDKIFLLTLEKSTERRNNFMQSYKKLNNFPLEIIWGINTKIPANAEKYRGLVDPYKFSIMYDLDSGKKQRTEMSDFNSGALGCYLGHMDFYKRCSEQGLKYALICEDNIVFDTSFFDEINNLIVPSDFDVIFFHSWNNISYNTSFCNSPKLKKLKKVMGTKCYLINVESMKKYYPLFYPIDNHIDFKYQDLIKKGCNVYYIPLESIDIRYTSESSTIGHSIIISQLANTDDPNQIAHKLFEMET